MPRAIYDACVLYPSGLRDLLVRLAEANLVQARWTERILDEMTRAVLRNRPDLSPDRVARTRRLMTAAVPRSMVTEYEGLIDGIELPDPDDRHVLAAAIRSDSTIIVTDNVKDFPAQSLARHGVTAERPDAFLWRVVQVRPEAVISVIREQAASLRKPPMTEDDLLDRLEAVGLHRSVEALRGLLEGEQGA